MADNIKTVQLLRVPEAAQALAVSEKTVWQWIYQRKISSTLIGRSRRISTSALKEFAERGSVPAVESFAA
jgi:excisionase family DNA binding protein